MTEWELFIIITSIEAFFIGWMLAGSRSNKARIANLERRIARIEKE